MVVTTLFHTRLKIPWICYVFYLVAILLNGCKHLETPYNNLKIINVFMKRSYGFHTPEVGDTHIWLLQFVGPIVNKALY